MADLSASTPPSAQPGDEPTSARQAELEAAYLANRKKRLPPYQGVGIRTTGEVAWIVRQRGWSLTDDARAIGWEEYRSGAMPIRADFRNADFRKANLHNAHLQHANLVGVRLDEATLTETNLDGANLSDEAAAKQRSSDLRVRSYAGRLLAAAVIAEVVALSGNTFGPYMLTLPGIGQVRSQDVTYIFTYVVLFALSYSLFMLAWFAMTRSLRSLVAAGDAGSPAISIVPAVMIAIATAIREVIESALSLPFRRREPVVGSGLDLRGASLKGANARYRSFAGANLQGATLTRADLTSANLTRADLTGAHLEGANISSADLALARMNAVDELRTMNLDSQTNLTDVQWASVPRTTSDNLRQREYRVTAQRDKSRVYRTVGLALRQQGLLAQAATYRLKEQRAERRALRLDGKPLRALGSFLLDAVSGYGERPARIFVTYLVVVSGFAASYWATTNVAWLVSALHVRSQPLLWYEALVLSLSSFHGRGFFPASLSLGDPLAIIAALEAVIGLFIELMLIATFSRRFLGN